MPVSLDVLSKNLRGGDSIKRASFVWDICIEIGPEFDQVKRVLGALLVQLLESSLLLRELVLNLPDVDGFEDGIRVSDGATDVDEEVLVVALGVSLLLDVGRELEKPQFVRGYRSTLPGWAGWLSALSGCEWGAAGEAAHGCGCWCNDGFVSAATEAERWLAEWLDAEMEKGFVLKGCPKMTSCFRSDKI